MRVKFVDDVTARWVYIFSFIKPTSENSQVTGSGNILLSCSTYHSGQMITFVTVKGPTHS